jgi:hypothetical protein
VRKVHSTAIKSWNLPMDVVGAGVYGGVVKRTERGKIVMGWWPLSAMGPSLDYSKLTPDNRGYSRIARVIQESRDGNASELDDMFRSIAHADRPKLANLVMTGGARPLHMCGMGREDDTSALIEVLLKNGADVNAKDNYEYTPMDRLSGGSCAVSRTLESHGGVLGEQLPRGVPAWDSDEFDYLGPGEADAAPSLMYCDI